MRRRRLHPYPLWSAQAATSCSPDSVAGGLLRQQPKPVERNGGVRRFDADYPLPAHERKQEDVQQEQLLGAVVQ